VFDLNRQIDVWKKGFSKRDCSSDELEELESHLREEIAALVAAGRTDEEAFRESVTRLGEPATICGELAKNEHERPWDVFAIRGNGVLVVLVGLAAVVMGVVVWTRRGDGVLGAHQGSILFAYVVPFLLAVPGTYAVFRRATDEAGEAQFPDRLAAHSRILFGLVALGCATGAFLGGFWAEQNLGRFWGWDPKEVGALSVLVCALALCLIVTRFKATSVRLGQACLIMSLVTFAAWFGPAVLAQALGSFALTLLTVCLVLQFAILSVPLFVPRRHLAEN
jgi:ABC-type transport system involved in cytochrome c biogenesis permease subunit